MKTHGAKNHIPVNLLENHLQENMNLKSHLLAYDEMSQLYVKFVNYLLLENVV